MYTQMEIKQVLFLPFHLCEQSGQIKDQEVLAQDLASRHLKKKTKKTQASKEQISSQEEPVEEVSKKAPKMR